MTAWYDPYEFQTTAIIENNFEAIRQEALTAFEMGLYTDHDQSSQSPVAIQKLANAWKQFRLLNAGLCHNELAKKYTPVTLNLLLSFPEIVNCTNGLAYFSLIPAGSIVKPHVGISVGARIRNQLCLVKPDDKQSTADDVFIRVNGEKRVWALGRVITFDDGYLHDVKNLSSYDRIVLLYDICPK